MNDKLINANAKDLERELNWFTQIVDTRFQLYFQEGSKVTDISDLSPPNLKKSSSYYAELVRKYDMSFTERLCLILGLVPHIRPRLLDIFYTKNKFSNRRYTEFGGVRDGDVGDFFPTWETLAFLVTGDDLRTRFALQSLLGRDHFFTKRNIFVIEREDASLKTALRLSKEYLSYLTIGTFDEQQANSVLPVQRIDSQLDWKDLVLNSTTMEMLQEVENWIRHGDVLLNDWGMSNRLRPGNRTLFHGPPGTGKTITAGLLGETTGHEVYRVDLSTLSSKYIGETEKNLKRVFATAENKSWILFFDEADALFGKRTEVKDASSRYANQEVSYLWQHIEAFKGTIIVAVSELEDLNQAFLRRFEAIIYFPMPGPQERLQLWKLGFSNMANLADDIDLAEIADKFELSGGMIMNVIRFISLKALARDSRVILLKDLLQGIKQELSKAGQVI